MHSAPVCSASASVTPPKTTERSVATPGRPPPLPPVTELHRRQGFRAENLPVVQLGNNKPASPPTGRASLGLPLVSGLATLGGNDDRCVLCACPRGRRLGLVLAPAGRRAD